MLGVAMYTTIKTLWELGKNKTEIARATGHDWKTVAKVIKGIGKGIDKPKPSFSAHFTLSYSFFTTEAIGD